MNKRFLLKRIKSALAILVAILMIFTTMLSFVQGASPVYVDTVGAWKDNAFTGFASGAGTVVSPYLISTSEEMAYLSILGRLNQTSGKYFVLTKSLDMAAHYWTPIGNGATAFTGFLDGAGYTISNVFMNPTTITDYSGFFSSINNSITDISKTALKNLTLDTIEIYGNASIGGLAGQVNGIVSGVEIKNAKIYAAMNRGAGTSGRIAYAGGFAGQISDGIYTDCKFSGDVIVNAVAESVQRFAGFAGDINYGITATNCSASGNVSGGAGGNSHDRGGFTGYINGPTGFTPINISNCSANVILPDASLFLSK